MSSITDRYGAGVSVMYSVDEPPAGRRHPLAKGASPESIAAALLPEDRGEFLAEYAAALNAARESLDLTSLFQMLEHWRRVAALQADPQVFRRVARRVAELLTGQPGPEDEPLAVTRQKAGGI
ncbi:MAG: DUF6247 family protein [Pseudonocardia sp.]